MFGRPNPSCGVLDKDPSGSWMVAPIVRKNKLLGFISADDHRQWNGPKQVGDPDFREEGLRVSFKSRSFLETVADLRAL